MKQLTDAEKESFGWLEKLCEAHMYADRLGPIRDYLKSALDTAQPVPEVDAMLVDALERVCSHGTRSSDQIGKDWDNARAALTAAKQAQPEPIGTPEQAARFLAKSLKPEEIGGAKRNERLRELMRWFDRFIDGNANPKWFRDHAYELAYAIATQPVQQAQPEPIKDHETAKLVNDLTAIAQEFHSHQSLRERIAQLVRPWAKGTQPERAPLSEAWLAAMWSGIATAANRNTQVSDYVTFARAVEAAIKQGVQQAQPECKCTFAQKTVGDGCAVCNPKLAAELSQPERAPLTDAEIHELYLKAPVHCVGFARALEAAHGIKQGGQHD